MTDFPTPAEKPEGLSLYLFKGEHNSTLEADPNAMNRMVKCFASCQNALYTGDHATKHTIVWARNRANHT